MVFAGEFETHLTINLDRTAGVDALRAWAESHGLKCLHILLARGSSPSQPMLTRRGRGDLAAQLQIANDLKGHLETIGFRVTRIKIEVAGANPDVPATEDAARANPGLYFEHHVKLLLDPNADLTLLANLSQRHSAHLSRNALRARDDGREERFVTQRCWLVGRDVARGRLQALTQDLESHAYPIIDVEEEFVVFDSNESIDAGWIEA